MSYKISDQDAAIAASKILGFYDTIPATDPKAFAAGLAATLLIFPREVVAKAVDPVSGIASKVAYPNLAKMRKCLDEWAEDWEIARQRSERARQRALPAPPEPDPETRARVAQGLRDLANHLKRGMGPSSI